MSPRAKFIIGTAAWLAIRAWAIPAFFIGWIVGTLTAWVRAGFDMATTVDSMPLARMIERNRPRAEEDQRIQPELADEEEYDWEDEP